MKQALFATVMLASLAATAQAGQAEDEAYCAQQSDRAGCNATRAYLRANYRDGANPRQAPKLPANYGVSYAATVDQMRFLIMVRITQGLA
jgi:opacity protein-like surface antigen